MLSPVDWRHYEWRSTEGVGGGIFLQIDAFVWRVQGYSTGGGLVTFQYQNGAVSTITLDPGAAFNVEPNGMRPGGFAIQFSAGVTRWVVEWLRQARVI